MKPALKLLPALALLATVPALRAVADDLPPYLRDRGPGTRTSMFATFVEKGQFLIYPFYEYYYDNNMQYSPDEYGVNSTQDYEAHYRAHEGLVFASYGFTDRLNAEMEVAVISAEFTKDPTDVSGTPASIKESGLGDVEGQITYRWLNENEKRPELYSFFEFVIPHAKEKPLIGTEDWELKFGTGGYRGLSFGTLWASISVEYTKASETPWDLGEWELGYLRRINPGWRVYGGIEGQATDEAAFIGEVQRRLTSYAFLKLNLGVGLTSNSTDFAPEVGVMFHFPNRN